MSVTGRDRKILIGLILVALVAGYWFLLLSPKREEAAKAQEEVTAQRERRDSALADVARLEQARTTYAADYASVVRLGKAIPETVDAASLLIQLQNASDGTGISFDSISVGQRAPVLPTGPAAPPASLEKAAGEQTGQVAPGAQPADPAGPEGEVAAAREDTPAARDAAAAKAQNTGAALEGVPLTFDFKGSFYGLADFFHEMKRFVEIANKDINVSGRLLTIDKLNLKGDSDFPNIHAELGATAYLVPKSEGVTGGATPAGPATAPASGSAPAAAPAAPAAPATPAAVAR